MKVTPKKVQTVVRTVIKQTEQKAEQQSKQKENEKYLTNALEAMSNTNRVNVRVPEFIIKKEDVLAKRKSTITDGVKKYIENCNDNSAELDAIDTILSIIDKGETKLDKSILEGFCKDSKIPENLIKDLQKVKKGLNKCVPVVKNKEDALKKIQAKATSKNMMIRPIAPFLTSSIPLDLSIASTPENRPCINPHAKKLKPTPCHTPHIAKMIMVLMIFLTGPFLLPPRGMYT